MKVRIISALVAILIAVPIIYFGGTIFTVAAYILGLIALKEFLDIVEIKKEVPILIKFMSFVAMTLMMFDKSGSKELIFTIDYPVVAGLLLMFLIPTIIYHEEKKYSVVDAFFLIGSIFFLSSAFKLFIILRDMNMMVLIYLILITVITDTYAYFTGYYIGKHKMLESISPKKTWEGFIGGTVIGVFVSTMFFTLTIDSSMPVICVVLMTLFLSILGQIGDLVFSAIKRHFNKKDFSNLMPGHGGILDRFDSIIFVMLGYLFFITFI